MHCKENACCREWHSQKIKSFLKDFEFKLQAPVFSKQRRGHYETFLHRSQSNNNFYGHDKQPTCVKAGFGKCDFCPSFHFKSKTEKLGIWACFTVARKKPMLNPHINVLYVGKPMQVWLLSIDIRKKKTTPNEKLVYCKSPLEAKENQQKCGTSG